MIAINAVNIHALMIKKRVKAELEKYQILCWITQGKEIENHIPYIAIERAKANGKIDRYDSKMESEFCNYTKVRKENTKEKLK